MQFAQLRDDGLSQSGGGWAGAGTTHRVSQLLEHLLLIAAVVAAFEVLANRFAVGLAEFAANQLFQMRTCVLAIAVSQYSASF